MRGVMMKFCRNCGEQLEDMAQYCNHCGHKCDDVNEPSFKTGKYSNDGLSIGGTTLTKVAYIFFVISIVLGALRFISGFFWNNIDQNIGFNVVFNFAGIISLALNVFFASKLKQAVNTGTSLSIGFKVCALIFGNLVSRICLLCDKEY